MTRHLIGAGDLSLRQIETLISLAQDIIANPKGYAGCCEGKKLATLFFEPSTRTRLSMEAAMLELGGSVIGFSSADSSSAAKGESITDTIRTVQCYADIIAIRHPKEGAARVAASAASVPVINCGDGGHEHPTQTLGDLLTINQTKGRFTGLAVGLCGDLKFGRTVHSLITTLARYEGTRFILVSPPELRVPEYIREDLIRRNIPFSEIPHLEDAICDMDILYMTRVQRERFFNEEDYLRLRDSYILDRKKLAMAQRDMVVMHPLPRVNEIATEVDNDSRAVYFRQVMYGKLVRKALIVSMLQAQNTGCGGAL